LVLIQLSGQVESFLVLPYCLQLLPCSRDLFNLDSSRWVYQYDDLGQVTSGKKYWSDGTHVAGQQFGYAFDDIGNRTTTVAGGNEFGADLRFANYTANNLNQYTSRTVPNAVDVIGTADASATVTVNNQATYRKGSYYRKELSIDNSLSPVWQAITNLAVLNDGNNPDIITNSTGHLFLPKTPEAFTYDADGNLTSDGRWTNRWDAENRLISMESLTNGPAGSKLKLLFGYDYVGRRISKTVSNWTGSAWALVSDQRFVYAGWNLRAILDPALNLQSSFMWGLDLSGSLQGAGGVGGLLLVTHHSSPVTSSFTCYDGNGNVTTLIDSGNSTITGQYEYGPFGETICLSGGAAASNPFRFSTKYMDSETDLLYYGYRYYAAGAGRWYGREPLGELESPNPYNFVGNNPVSSFDVNGLYDWDGHFGGTYAQLISMGYDPNLARQLSYYAVMPDKITEYSAWDNVGRWLGSLTTDHAFFKDVQEWLHSLHGGGPNGIAGRRSCIMNLLQGSKLDVWEKGFLIHALGDTFAHTWDRKAAPNDKKDTTPISYGLFLLDMDSPVQILTKSDCDLSYLSNTLMH
jgi:RHS repeat-associated protein